MTPLASGLFYRNPYFDNFRTLRELEEKEEESPLKDELKPWQRGTWEQCGTKTTRIGLIARKIGVVPMWYKNGRPCDVTMLHVSKFPISDAVFYQILL